MTTSSFPAFFRSPKVGSVSQRALLGKESFYRKKFKRTFKPIISPDGKIKITFNLPEINRDNIDGCKYFFDETVKTFMKIVKTLAFTDDHMALLGLCQSAKTHSQQCGVMIGSVARCLIKKEACLPMFLSPNQIGFKIQFENKMSEIYDFISGLQLVVTHINKNKKEKHRGSSYVGSYFKAIEKEISTKILQTCAKIGNPILGQSAIKSLAGGFFLDTVSKKNEKVLGLLCHVLSELNKDKSRGIGWGAIIVRDESHAAAHQGSVNDKLFNGDYPDDSDEIDKQNIYSLLNSLPGMGVKFIFLAVSATNWPGIHLKIIHVVVNEDYCGLDFGYIDCDAEGNEAIRLVSDGVKISTPKFCSLSGMGQKMNLPVLSDLRPRWFSDSSSFYKSLAKELHRHPDHAEYRIEVIKSLAMVVNKQTKGNSKTMQGALLRLVNNNTTMDGVIEGMKEYLDDDIIVIPYYGANAQLSVSDLIASHGILGSRYLVVATNKARMADTFPTNCGLGIDCSYDSTTLASLMQGVLGRVCGYNKKPIIVLGDKNIKTVKSYIDSGFLEVIGKKFTNTISGRRSRTAFSFHESSHGGDPVIRRIIDEFNKYLMPRKSINMDACPPQLSLGESAKDFDPLSVISYEDMNYIQDNILGSSLRLIIPGKEPKNRLYDRSKKNNNILMTSRGEGKFKNSKGEVCCFSDKKGGKCQERILLRWKCFHNKPKVVGFDLPVVAKIDMSSETNMLNRIQNRP